MIIYHEEVYIEIEDIVLWYDQRSNRTGDLFLATLNEAVKQIEFTPQMYGKVPRCPKGRDVRQMVLDPFEYILTYENTPDQIVILSITHAKRRSKPWRSRLS